MRLRDVHEYALATAPYRRPLHWCDESKQGHNDNSHSRLLHNHPSGDPTPSDADIQMTKQIADIASSLGIAVHDHIIVGKNGHASLKGLKLI